MSVILDALKRVQDESRRREGESGGSRSRPDERPNSDAMLRRLHSGSRPDRSRAGGVSPAIWVAAGGVAILALVAVALWWVVPSIQPSRNIDQQPLLADLTAESSSEQPAGEQPATDATTTPPPRQTSPPEDSGRPAAGTASDADRSAPGGPDMSDLSGAVGERPSSPTSAEGRQAREPGYLQGSGRDASAQGSPETSPASPPASTDVEGPGDTSQAARDSGAEGEPFLQIETSGSGDDAGDTAGQRSSQSGDATGPVSSSPMADTRNSGRDVRLGRRSSGGQQAGGLVDPGVRSAFQEGVRYQKNGDLQSAEGAYQRGLDLDPKNAKLNANLGVLYEAQGKLDLAEQHLRTAIANEPDNAVARNNLGVVLYRKGNLNGALTEFKRALALKPDNLDAYTNIGLIYTRWGEYEKAESAFLDALAVNPQHALSQYNLGLVYEEQEEFGRAVDRYRAFLQIGGSDHPELVDFLVPHLRWLEARTGQASSGR